MNVVKTIKWNTTFELGKIERREKELGFCITRYDTEGNMIIAILYLIATDEDLIYFFLIDFDFEGTTTNENEAFFSSLKMVKFVDSEYMMVDFSGMEIVITQNQYNVMRDFIFSRKYYSLQFFTASDESGFRKVDDMYCGKCGTMIKDNCFFCTNCGEPADTKNNEYCDGETVVCADLNEYIDSVLSIGDSLDSKASNEDDDLSFREIIRMELVKFCLYICSTNDASAHEKAMFLRDYLDFDDVEKLLEPAINHTDLFGDISSIEVPVSFKLMATFDKQISTKGCKILLNAYKHIGTILLYCNATGNICKKSTEGYNSYISMLENYIESECGYSVK